MSDSILRNLKAFGLTPWQLVLGLCIGYGWVASKYERVSLALTKQLEALN